MERLSPSEHAMPPSRDCGGLVAAAAWWRRQHTAEVSAAADNGTAPGEIVALMLACVASPGTTLCAGSMCGRARVVCASSPSLDSSSAFAHSRGVSLGVKKNDLDLNERSRKVSHFSLQATHPESSSERVLTARRYRNFGRQRFESMGKVWVADRSGVLADRLPCRRDDEAWTVAAVMVSRCRLSCVFGLVRCAWAAAGICRSQVRHFEGIFTSSPAWNFSSPAAGCEWWRQQRLMPCGYA